MGKKGEPTSHTALYRKHRPRSLDDFVGQSHVVEILRRSLKKGRIAHAYLLTGPKGTGKTTIARILAHEINQLPYTGDETHLDIIEIDAASNNGVDDVRDLREKVMLAPTSAPKKVYIIDEVHMLSKAAFNALLKTLEEPPSHIVFILATTDLHKVPATIISRTQHYSIHTYSPAEITAHLRKIADVEGIRIDNEALDAIAARGEGSFRNSISLLDQLSGFADDKQGVTLDLVESTLGLAPSDAVRSLLKSVGERDVAGIISQLDELEKQGIQPVILADQLIQTVRAQLGDHPHLVTLLDSLLSVSTASQPGLKLLTVLVGAIKPKTAASAHRAPALVIEAPAPKPNAAPAPVKPVETPIAKPTVEIPASTIKTTPRKKPSGDIKFDWSELVEYTRANQPPLYGVLGKCEYEFDGATLTLYAGRKFNKMKLDEPKYQGYLFESLEKLGIRGVEVVTLPTTKPPSDEKLAKVADIMGGGREVSLSDIGV